MDTSESDIHNRRPRVGSATPSDANDANNEERNHDMAADEEKSKKTKTTQAQRDAHFQEDGVRADGTVPKPKGEGDEEGK